MIYNFSGVSAVLAIATNRSIRWYFSTILDRFTDILTCEAEFVEVFILEALADL